METSVGVTLASTPLEMGVLPAREHAPAAHPPRRLWPSGAHTSHHQAHLNLFASGFIYMNIHHICTPQPPSFPSHTNYSPYAGSVFLSFLSDCSGPLKLQPSSPYSENCGRSNLPSRAPSQLPLTLGANSSTAAGWLC